MEGIKFKAGHAKVSERKNQAQDSEPARLVRGMELDLHVQLRDTEAIPTPFLLSPPRQSPNSLFPLQRDTEKGLQESPLCIKLNFT
ncbi:hypothetical protein HAX54_018165, partial [Datura stramonium]|nr:hypothetical protein [Datura stramonium]